MNFRDSEYLIPIFDFDILNMQLNTPLFILALVLLVMFLMNRLLFQPVLRTARPDYSGTWYSHVSGERSNPMQ